MATRCPGGGGCYTYSAGGDTLESCISAGGHYAEPDGYIINNSGCAAAYLDVLEGNEVQVAQYNVGCSDGIVIESLIGWPVTVSW